MRVDEFSPIVFDTLCTAFEIFIKINQINGRYGENYHSNLTNMVNAAMNKENVVLKQLVKRVLKGTDIDMIYNKCDTVEECKIL